MKKKKRQPDWRVLYLREREENARLRERNLAYSGALSDVKAKLNVALDKLKDLSSGLVPSDMPTSWSYDTKLQASAARTVRFIATMQQREAP